MATPLQTYENSAERTNSLKWQNATINDVASKYGFNFSKDYANQQADTVAQEQRNAQMNMQRQNQSMNKQNIGQINSNLKSGVVGTENTFFQNYLKQRQSQANRGINAGFQADQDLRLGMNQQSVLADLYRDAGNNKAKEMDRFTNQDLQISDALSLIEKQKQTEAEKLYQDMITKGYGMLGTERGWYNTLDQQAYGKYRDQIADEQEAARAAAAVAQRAASQKAAQQAQQAQQSALDDLYGKYQDTLKKQATPQSPLQKYENTPGKVAVRDYLAANPTDVASKYALTSRNSSLAVNPNYSPYDKMKMLEAESRFW